MHRTLVSAGLAVGALAIGGVLGSFGANQPTVSSQPTTIASTSFIEVHVAGWVIAPGVVSVSDDAIVADAIAAAGGLRSGARSDLINLAAAVGPGEQVLVSGPEGVDQGSSEDGPIRLNSASAEELESLPGVGPVLAQKIETFREDNGPFGQVEDLLQVSGIGEAKLASIRDFVRVP